MIQQNQVTEVSNRIIATLENVYRKLKNDSKFQKIVDELDNFYNEYGGVTRCEFVLDDDNIYHSQYYGNKETKTYTGDLYLVDNAEDVGRLYLEGSCENVGNTQDDFEAYFAIGRNMNKRKALYTDFKEELAVTSKVYAYMVNVLKAEARKQKLNLKPSKKDAGLYGNNAFVFEISLGKRVKMEDTIQGIRQERLQRILEKYNTSDTSECLTEGLEDKMGDFLAIMQKIVESIYSKLNSNAKLKDILKKILQAYKIADNNDDFWDKAKLTIRLSGGDGNNFKKKPSINSTFWTYDIDIYEKTLGKTFFSVHTSASYFDPPASIDVWDNTSKDLINVLRRSGIKDFNKEALPTLVFVILQKAVKETLKENEDLIKASAPKVFRNGMIEYCIRQKGKRIHDPDLEDDLKTFDHIRKYGVPD